MLPCYTNAWLLKPGNVMGKRMRELSVGHFYLLEASDSPFVHGGQVLLSDLVFATMICSMPFKAARDILFADPQKLLRKGRWWGMIFSFKRYDLQQETDAFMNYWKAYTEMPERWQDTDKKAKTSAIPWSLRLAWLLMERMPEDKAWDMPMPRACSYYACWAEANGVDFVSEDHLRVIGE